MTSHYYNNNLETKSLEKTFTVNLLGNALIFITDHGVFSKERVDYGSRVLIESWIREPWYKKVLEVGCGYGPIGISLAKVHPDIHFDLIDVNLRAIDLTKRNAKLNNVHNVSVFESNIYENIKDKYDCIISNPPIRAGKVIVHQILEDAFHHLNENGSLFVVIQKKQGAPSAEKKLEQIFGNVEIVCRDKGYYVLKSCKKIK